MSLSPEDSDEPSDESDEASEETSSASIGLPARLRGSCRRAKPDPFFGRLRSDGLSIFSPAPRRTMLPALPALCMLPAVTSARAAGLPTFSPAPRRMLLPALRKLPMLPAVVSARSPAPRRTALPALSVLAMLSTLPGRCSTAAASIAACAAGVARRPGSGLGLRLTSPSLTAPASPQAALGSRRALLTGVTAAFFGDDAPTLCGSFATSPPTDLTLPLREWILFFDDARRRRTAQNAAVATTPTPMTPATIRPMETPASASAPPVQASVVAWPAAGSSISGTEYLSEIRCGCVTRVGCSSTRIRAPSTPTPRSASRMRWPLPYSAENILARRSAMTPSSCRLSRVSTANCTSMPRSSSPSKANSPDSPDSPSAIRRRTPFRRVIDVITTSAWCVPVLCAMAMRNASCAWPSKSSRPIPSTAVDINTNALSVRTSSTFTFVHENVFVGQ
mmetsp:Transcript_15848/g.55139  ORF Transcript_15848/g.55139 Transcript_15848/m.55139 type:complete len:449 (+) Transcript_15848:246-1592(+)